MPVIMITLEEAWSAHRFVRQTDKLGVEHDKEQQLRLHAALAWLRDHPASEYAMEVDEGFLWWIERQVPDQLTVGSTHVGRNLLYKVQAALLAMATVAEAEPDAPGESAVPVPFRRWQAEEDAAQAEWVRLHPEDGKEQGV